METWLRCTVSEGQFDGEFAVSGETHDGTGFSLFVPEGFVDLDQPLPPPPVKGSPPAPRFGDGSASRFSTGRPIWS